MIEIEGAEPLNGGFVAGLPPHLVGAAESPDAENFDPADAWGVTTRLGSSLYVAATASSQNSGMTTGDIVIHPTTGIVFVRGASIILWAPKDSAAWASLAGSGVELATIMGGATLNIAAASAASGPQTMIVTDATIPVLFNPLTNSVYNASMASAGTIVSFAEVYANRVFIGGRRDGFFVNYVNYSALNNITDWTTASNAGAFQVGDSAAINGMKACRNALYVFKRNSIWMVSGTSPTDFTVENVTTNIGLISPRGTASDGQGVYFASDDGIWYLNGLNLSRVSDKVRAEYLAIPDKSKIALAYKGEKLFCFRNSSGTSPNTQALIVAPRRKIETGEVQPIWAKWASQPFGGVTVGGNGTYNYLIGVTVTSSLQVYKLDTASDASVPNSVPVTWNSPDWDFRDPDAKKKLLRWTAHFKPATATVTYTAQWFVNGASAGSPYTIEIGSDATTHEGDNRMGMPEIVGDYLRLRLRWAANSTLYGYTAFADVQVATDDMPRRRD